MLKLRKSCPAYPEHLADCALLALSPAGSDAEIQEAIARLGDDDVQEILRKHFLCLCRKDGCDIH